MVEDLSISLDLIAAVLGHDSGSAATATLRRHYIAGDQVERKAVALREWDKFIGEIIAGAQIRGDNAVSTEKSPS
jgi:hypothetical protein